MIEPNTAPDEPSRGRLVAALGVAVTTVAAVLAIAAIHRPARGPVVVAAVPTPHAADPACAALLAALPSRLGGVRRAQIAEPAPEGVAAWRADGGGEPVLLRCGLDRPEDFVVGSPIQVVDSVQWFQVRDADRSTWYAVDRPVYLALTLPPGSGPTPIQQLSEVIDDTVAAVPINPAPPR